MDTRAFYKQDYEAQMRGRSLEVADEKIPLPAAEPADVPSAAVLTLAPPLQGCRSAPRKPV